MGIIELIRSIISFLSDLCLWSHDLSLYNIAHNHFLAKSLKKLAGKRSYQNMNY